MYAFLKFASYNCRYACREAFSTKMGFFVSDWSQMERGGEVCDVVDDDDCNKKTKIIIFIMMIR